MSTKSKIGRLPFTFSLAERDRRYQAVRDMMAKRGFDAIIAPCNTTHNDNYQADVRYLTQVGGFSNEAAVFLPASGEPTCWVRADSQPAQWWLDMQDWVRNVRGSDCTWSANFATSIREYGLESATIGVVGIGGTPRSPDGLILYGTLSRLQSWFPRANFESATEAMAEVRAIKSVEEIAALQRATEIAEQSLLAMAAMARPGVSEHEAYGEIVAHMVKNGGELPTLVLWGAGAAPKGMSRLPPVRPLEAGDVIISEVEGRCVGYGAQVERPVFLGQPSAEYQRLHELAVESFEAGYGRMQPGATYEYVISGMTELIHDRGYRTRGVPLSAQGLGEDPPVINLAMLAQEVVHTEIKVGQVFSVVANVITPDEDKQYRWGNMVVVTETGVRRLGQLSYRPIVAPA